MALVGDVLKESPTFNLDRVTTPVRIVAIGPGLVLGIWEWVSGLSLQERPGISLRFPTASTCCRNSGSAEPRCREMVDWLRFWLKGEEDSDPAKAEQYARWRKLRKIQEQNEKKSVNAASPTSN